MTSEILQQLLDEYAMGTISPEDRQRLLAALRDPVWAGTVGDFLLEDLHAGRYDVVAEEFPEVGKRLQQHLATQLHAAKQVPVASHRNIFRMGWRKVAAAVLLIGGVAAAVIYLSNPRKVSTKNTAGMAANIGPGGHKAMLTLSDGSTILLDDASKGAIAQQGNTQILKQGNGQLAYQPQSGTNTATLWNTVSTPQGGDYQVALPDGTKAWLNAASAITFPAAFTGKERQVTVKGEVYLEVVQSAAHPFTVIANGVAIKVLGTSFNINAYNDEDYTKITLVTGSIKINSGNRDWLLKPGQQAAANNRDATVKVSANADLEQVLAWKNGLFNFNGADIRAVMPQLERWYGIKVVYEGAVPDIVFKGEMYKNVNLSDVLEMLKAMGVKCRMDGKTLIVSG